MGNDTYVVGKGDTTIENTDEGIDTVQSSITWTLANNVENLTLTGTSAIKGTGNALDNVLIGNSAINTLTGGAGNDRLDGKGGADKMLGGAGNDTYVVDVSTDVITENANEGTDTVETGIAYTLGSNVENLNLTGIASINGTGNTLNNMLRGNSGANILTGNAGNDTLDGDTGNDTLNGGTGNDRYIFCRGGGVDSLTDNDITSGNSDTVEFSTNPLDLIFSRSGSDLKIGIAGSTDSLTVKSWYSGSAYQTEVLQSANGTRLLNTQVESLIQAMAAFSSQSGLTWEQAVQNRPDDVQALLTAHWKQAV